MECCKLVHLKRNGGDGTAFPLTRKSTLILGRDPECDFRVQVPGAADKHVKLTVDKNGKVYVTSLAANAPAKLGGRDVVKKNTPILNSEVLKIGTCSFRFDYIKSLLQATNGVYGRTTGKTVAVTTGNIPGLAMPPAPTTNPSQQPPPPQQLLPVVGGAANQPLLPPPPPPQVNRIQQVQQAPGGPPVQAPRIPAQAPRTSPLIFMVV